MTDLKIALVHDSFTQMGGAERVVDALHEMFPAAPVFTTVFDREFQSKYAGWDIRSSSMQFLYNLYPNFKYLLPFIPAAVFSINFSGYNIVLSSSSGFAKNIHVPKGCVHINYCHTPARFLWSDTEYVNQETPFFVRPFAKLFLKWMKLWDYRGAQRVNTFIANSEEVRQRLRRYYNRDSEVIHPFINTDFWKPVGEKQNYFLLGGRLQTHKKNELIVEIFNELGLPLHIFGTGRQEAHLKSIAKSNITFFGRILDEQLREEYSGAQGFIYPQLEDFGLMPLEAAACGTATLGFAQGGALETIKPGVTGELFESYDKEKIKTFIENWNPVKYRNEDLICHSTGFSKDIFKKLLGERIRELGHKGAG